MGSISVCEMNNTIFLIFNFLLIYMLICSLCLQLMYELSEDRNFVWLAAIISIFEIVPKNQKLFVQWMDKWMSQWSLCQKYGLPQIETMPSFSFVLVFSCCCDKLPNISNVRTIYTLQFCMWKVQHVDLMV